MMARTCTTHRVLTALVLTGVLAGTSACGGSDPGPEAKDRSADPSTSPTPSATASTTASPTPTAPVRKSNPARLGLGEVKPLALHPGKKCKAEKKNHNYCTVDGKAYYHLVKGTLQQVYVTDVVPTKAERGDEWTINLQFDPPGTGTLARISGRLAKSQGQLAIFTRDERILAAPLVQAPIKNGRAAMSADWNRAEAQRIVKLITGQAG